MHGIFTVLPKENSEKWYNIRVRVVPSPKIAITLPRTYVELQ